MTTKDKKPDISALAAEVQHISHVMRSALTVLKVGTQMAAEDPMDLVGIAPSMSIKVDEIDKYCDRLSEISAQLNLQLSSQ